MFSYFSVYVFSLCTTFLPLWYCLSASISCNCNYFYSFFFFLCWRITFALLPHMSFVCLCAFVRSRVRVKMCVGLICGFLHAAECCAGSASSVWALVITVLHCFCRSQWSWTHCLSLHGSQQLCEFPSDIAATAKPASCIFYHAQCVSVCPLSFSSLFASVSFCFCVCVWWLLLPHPAEF